MGYTCDPETALVRFWQKVDRRSKQECWNWIGTRAEDGTGHFVATTKNLTAYRYSWEIHKGPIPAHLCVLHKCDNRACVNPNHLFLGTKKPIPLTWSKRAVNGSSRLRIVRKGTRMTMQTRIGTKTGVIARLVRRNIGNG